MEWCGGKQDFKVLGFSTWVHSGYMDQYVEGFTKNPPTQSGATGGEVWGPMEACRGPMAIL